MVALKQVGFGGGELSPQLYGRSDQKKYAEGMRLCRNVIVQRFGGIENRSGSLYIDQAIDNGMHCRIVKFVFNYQNSYLMVFSDGLMVPYKNGLRIPVGSPAAWSSVTSYVLGNIVSSGGNTWVCQLANLNHAPAAGIYWLQITDGFVRIPTGIPSAALGTMQVAQQNDIMTLSSQSFFPQELSRFSDTNWTMANFVPQIGAGVVTGVLATAGVAGGSSPAAPTGLSASGGTFGPNSSYRVTAFNSSGEGAPSSIFTLPAAASAGTPITVTWTAVGGATGYVIYKSLGTGYGIIGIMENATTFSDAMTSGATSVRQVPSGSSTSTTFTYVVTSIDAITLAESLTSVPGICVGSTPTATQPNVITWNPVTGASKYNVYSVVNGTPGYVGSSSTTTFDDINYLPNTAIQPPVTIPLFQTSNDWPACVAYYQQRLAFANTINQPQTVWMSQTGNRYNFNVVTPTADNGAIQFTIAGKQAQPVQSLVDLGKLIIHTANGEYVCTGNQAGTLTPSVVGLVLQGSAGSNLIQPVVIGNTDIFVQARGQTLRDLRYDIQSYSYTGKDLTNFSAHLFSGRTVIDMDWQQIKNSIVWCTLDNGALLGQTYVREHELWAWHHHDMSNGFVENVCVVPEATEDVLYLIVRRVINGTTVRYIERLANREFQDTVMLSDAVFCDSAQIYDGRNTGATFMSLSTTAGWTPQDTLTLTASTNYFSSGDVGNAIVYTQLDINGLVTNRLVLSIIAYTAPTAVKVQASANVPTWAQASPITSWGKAVKHFSGIGHLEGQAISVLADGNVASNPNNTGFAPIIVSGGAFSLPSPAVVVCAGLPITADIATLDVENQQGETLSNKTKLIIEACPIFYNTRGGLYGNGPTPTALFAWPQRTSADRLGFPTALVTGPQRIALQGDWQKTGQVFIRQQDPLPMGISALVLTGQIGG